MIFNQAIFVAGPVKGEIYIIKENIKVLSFRIITALYYIFFVEKNDSIHV